MAKLIQQQQGFTWFAATWPRKSTLKDLAEANDLPLQIVNDAVAAQEKLRSSGKLTAEGVKSELREHVLKVSLPALTEAQRVIARGRKARTEVGEHLAPFDRRSGSDVAGALLASEIRAYYRSLEPDKRTRSFHEAIRGGDRETIRALLEAPAFLSGVGEQSRDLAVRELSRDRDPERAEHVEQLDQAVEQVGRHVEQATVALRRLAGLEAEEVRQIMGDKEDAEEAA